MSSGTCCLKELLRVRGVQQSTRKYLLRQRHAVAAPHETQQLAHSTRCSAAVVNNINAAILLLNAAYIKVGDGCRVTSADFSYSREILALH